jgi:hypothetical protein
MFIGGGHTYFDSQAVLKRAMENIEDVRDRERWERRERGGGDRKDGRDGI